MERRSHKSCYNSPKTNSAKTPKLYIRGTLGNGLLLPLLTPKINVIFYYYYY